MDDRTAEILNRFDESWIQTEAFYDDLINNHTGWERLIPVMEFLTDLDQSGGRTLYRLGTSIHWLIISRSVDHGLRSDQKSIRIDAINTNDFEVTTVIIHASDDILAGMGLWHVDGQQYVGSILTDHDGRY